LKGAKVGARWARGAFPDFRNTTGVGFTGSDVVGYIGRARGFFDGFFGFLGGADVAAFPGVFEDGSFPVFLSGNPEFFGHPFEGLE